MSDFYCGICGYITYSKSSIDRHKMRKTPCKPKKTLPTESIVVRSEPKELVLRK